jgi:uncharacterized membrane protein YphA (DoxX/SURF4 family)
MDDKGTGKPGQYNVAIAEPTGPRISCDEHLEITTHYPQNLNTMIPVIYRSRKFILAYKHIIIEIISALFILLFTYTALSKLTDYNLFRYQLQTYPFISKFGDLISWAVPVAELIAVVFLLIPKTRRIGLFASLLLMTGFTIYLTLMIIFGGKDLPCSCGGVIQRLTWSQHIIFNVFFTGLALWALRLQKYQGVDQKSKSEIGIA